jgi:hypothetical protein
MHLLHDHGSKQETTRGKRLVHLLGYVQIFDDVLSFWSDNLRVECSLSKRSTCPALTMTLHDIKDAAVEPALEHTR